MDKTILIVEDEEHIAEGLQLNLEMEGYKTIIASDGNAALDIYHSTNVDLILLDVMLPGISGFDVCRQIRKEAGRVPHALALMASRHSPDGLPETHGHSERLRP